MKLLEVGQTDDREKFIRDMKSLEVDGFEAVDKLVDSWIGFRILIKTALWFPPVLILGVLIFSFYIYVYMYCYKILFVRAGYYFLAGFFTIDFLVIFTFAMWSFYMVVFSDPGRVPQEFSDKIHELSNMTLEEGQKTEFTVCRRCQVPRPPRAHHCRHCRVCIRKMDHHCPVVNNCVGWGNYKYFILLLTWCDILCWFGALTGILKYLLVGIQGMVVEEIQIFIGLALGFIYGVGLIGFGGFHYYLVFTNSSTMDNMIPTDKKISYDMGYQKNFEQVFGDRPSLWFVPVFTTQGDGCYFPHNKIGQDV